MKAIIWIIVVILAAWLVIWLVRRTPTPDTSFQEPNVEQEGAVSGATTGPDDEIPEEFQDKG
ncbi:MAG: hypothetical protein UY54_C0021G0009, partial [Parcubacteria group bacterium GW2011_GWA2_50_10b]